MTTETIIKEIVYVTAGDYDCFVTIDGQREYIGSAPSYHDGELKCNNYAYHYYADNHTPEVAAAIAVEAFYSKPNCCGCGIAATWQVRTEGSWCFVCNACYRDQFEENLERQEVWEADRLPTAAPPPPALALTGNALAANWNSEPPPRPNVTWNS